MILYGHRGARGLAPENTLVAFRKARDLGLEYVELDIQITSDKHLVVIHDHTVDRTTDGSGRVGDLTLDEIKRLDAGSFFAPEYRGIRVPTFEEFCGAFAEDFSIQLEIKSYDQPEYEALIPIMIARLRRYGLYERTVVTSFSAEVLEAVKKMEPGLNRGYISSRDPEDSIERAAKLGCVTVGLATGILSPAIVREAHALGMEVTGWQGNTEQEMEILRTSGVDSFSSDVPDFAIEWLHNHSI